MNLTIDTTVTFDLAEGRKAVLDIGQLQEFQESLYRDRGTDEPVVGTDGQPKQAPDGQPLMRRTLSFKIIEPALVAYVKEATAAQPGGPVEINRWEARALWDLIPGAWEKKRASWRDFGHATPTLSRSTDPASWD